MFGFLQRLFGYTKRPESPRLAQIRNIVLFATLRPKELRVIDGLLHERHYLKGEVIFDQGDEGQALYAVLSGRVVIYKRTEQNVELIAEVRPGSVFGELALLGGAPRVAQARAAEDCLLAALSRADFERLIETHGAIASRIAVQLARDLGNKLGTRSVPIEPPQP